MAKDKDNINEIQSFLVVAHAMLNFAKDIRDERGDYVFEYKNDKFVFNTRYISNGHIIGQEAISEMQNGEWVRVWSMIFQGKFTAGVTTSRDEVLSFLRMALQLNKFDKNILPVRGPTEFKVSSWTYTNKCPSKELSDFKGSEVIKYDNAEVFILDYSGTFVNEKKI
jgi:hypothetical protein